MEDDTINIEEYDKEEKDIDDGVDPAEILDFDPDNDDMIEIHDSNDEHDDTLVDAIKNRKRKIDEDEFGDEF